MTVSVTMHHPRQNHHSWEDAVIQEEENRMSGFHPTQVKVSPKYF